MDYSAIAANKSLLFGIGLFFSAFSAVFAISISAGAQASNPAQAHITVVGEPGIQQGQKAHEKLDVADEPLSEVQLQRLAANARIYKEKVRPLQSELRTNKRRLTEILTDEDISVPNAQVLQSKIGQLKTEIRDLQLKKQLADSQILTVSQRKALRGQSEQHKILALTGKTVE